MLNVRTKLLILQHPQEPGETLASVPVLLAEIPSAVVRVGLSWPNLFKALGQSVDSKEWGVLFLGTKASATSSDKRQPLVCVVDKNGQARGDSTEILSQLKGIVALDGSWREAKTLWWRNPWLLKLKRIVLSPVRPSIYGRLRREPRRDSLSTLEAVALCLSAMEANPEIETILLNAFEAFLAGKKRVGSPT